MGRRRRKYLPWVVCATLAAAGVPALALGQADPPSSASVTVSDTGFAPATVDILVGGKVNFSYPSGSGVYNVVWDRGSLEPATCEQTQGTVWGYGTTLPWWMQGRAVGRQLHLHEARHLHVPLRASTPTR